MHEGDRLRSVVVGSKSLRCDRRCLLLTVQLAVNRAVHALRATVVVRPLLLEKEKLVEVSDGTKTDGVSPPVDGRFINRTQCVGANGRARWMGDSGE